MTKPTENQKLVDYLKWDATIELARADANYKEMLSTWGWGSLQEEEAHQRFERALKRYNKMRKR